MDFDGCTGWCIHHYCIKQNSFTVLKVHLCFIYSTHEEPAGRISALQVSGPVSREAPTAFSAGRGQHMCDSAPTREEPAILLGGGVRQLSPTQPQSQQWPWDLDGHRQGLLEGLKPKSPWLQAFQLIYKITRLLMLETTGQRYFLLTRPSLYSKVKNAT